jgi:MOSC domain-containing protein YiiM
MIQSRLSSGDGTVVAVCLSPGGIPKLPVASGRVGADGLEGDGHAHEKHRRPDRAISIVDLETLRELQDEGFALSAGAIGENLTVEGLGVQTMPPGTLLKIGHVVLRLEEPRKPCYVLDAIDPRLQHELRGRCGYMASVVRGGAIAPRMPICLLETSSAGSNSASLRPRWRR